MDSFGEHCPIPPLINFILGPISLPWPAFRLIFLSAISSSRCLFILSCYTMCLTPHVSFYALGYEYTMHEYDRSSVETLLVLS
ncbi:hypothetical protein F4604DRAFT_1793785 [Suillus subluteus]|nr:hypothetical protein F4604DRAFT_1793785 [Suillus subluteus]